MDKARPEEQVCVWSARARLRLASRLTDVSAGSCGSRHLSPVFFYIKNWALSAGQGVTDLSFQVLRRPRKEDSVRLA